MREFIGISSFRKAVRHGVILMIAMVGWGACAEEKPPGYYEHEDGFSLIWPDGWQYEEDAGDASVVGWRGERDSLALKDSTAPVVTVVTVPLPPEADNNKFADLNFREVTTAKNYLPMRDDKVFIDGDSLPVLVYAYKEGNAWRQGMLTSIVAGDDEKKGFVILCSSKPGKLEGDKKDYVAILESFIRE